MKDILIDEGNDLRLLAGDFEVGYSDNQQQKAILTTEKGEWKEHPEVGGGISQMLADDLYTETLIEIKKQLEYDGMQINDVALQEGGKLLIDGQYNYTKQTSPKTRHYHPAAGYAYQDRGKPRRVRRTFSLSYLRLCS